MAYDVALDLHLDKLERVTPCPPLRKPLKATSDTPVVILGRRRRLNYVLRCDSLKESRIASFVIEIVKVSTYIA